jgi:hypothetical protein
MFLFPVLSVVFAGCNQFCAKTCGNNLITCSTSVLFDFITFINIWIQVGLNKCGCWIEMKDCLSRDCDCTSDVFYIAFNFNITNFLSRTGCQFDNAIWMHGQRLRPFPLFSIRTLILMWKTLFKVNKVGVKQSYKFCCGRKIIFLP